MKKVWKWIIGIVLGLIVLALLVGLGFLVRNNFHAYRTETFYRGYTERGPSMMPYEGYGFHMRGPGMMGYGIMPFGGLIGGLFSLGILVLLVLGIIWLVRSIRTPKTSAASSATPSMVASETPAGVTNPCKRCGKPLQSDWKVCPHCGKKV